MERLDLSRPVYVFTRKRVKAEEPPLPPGETIGDLIVSQNSVPILQQRLNQLLDGAGTSE